MAFTSPRMINTQFNIITSSLTYV